jgi:DNA mismatch endonuclease (patch repair protein)
MMDEDLMKRQQRSKIMRAIKSKNTSVEILLAKALWRRGHRYRKNDKTIFGTPDLVFKKYRIAVFVDGEFFHGYKWEEKKLKLQDNREYWISKIERNIERDNKVNEYLASTGWVVIRFWGADIKKKLRNCVKMVENEIEEMKAKIYYLNTIKYF